MLMMMVMNENILHNSAHHIIIIVAGGFLCKVEVGELRNIRNYRQWDSCPRNNEIRSLRKT